MKVFQGFEQLPRFKNTVLTVGAFDGVHKAHKYIIDFVKNIAKQENGETVLLTFEPHPRIVLNNEISDFKLLTNIEEKIKLLENCGVENLIIANFSSDFSQLEPADYIQNILIKTLGLKHIVIGYNHHFGKDRKGNFDTLFTSSAQNHFKVSQIPKQLIEAENISSTNIRAALQQGNIRLANEMLAHDYFIQGEVIHGNKLGRTIGFPTANIHIKDHYKLIPKNGVYAVQIIIENRILNGMMNIGYKPTFGENKLSLEVHIFDFNENIYHQNIEIRFIENIRNEQKFQSKEELIHQLNKDEQLIRSILS